MVLLPFIASCNQNTKYAIDSDSNSDSDSDSEAASIFDKDHSEQKFSKELENFLKQECKKAANSADEEYANTDVVEPGCVGSKRSHFRELAHCCNKDTSLVNDLYTNYPKCIPLLAYYILTNSSKKLEHLYLLKHLLKKGYVNKNQLFASCDIQQGAKPRSPKAILHVAIDNLHPEKCEILLKHKPNLFCIKVLEHDRYISQLSSDFPLTSLYNNLIINDDRKSTEYRKARKIFDMILDQYPSEDLKIALNHRSADFKDALLDRKKKIQESQSIPDQSIQQTMSYYIDDHVKMQNLEECLEEQDKETPKNRGIRDGSILEKLIYYCVDEDFHLVKKYSNLNQQHEHTKQSYVHTLLGNSDKADGEKVANMLKKILQDRDFKAQDHINRPDIFGNLPLKQALEFKASDYTNRIIELLLEYGADPNQAKGIIKKFSNEVSKSYKPCENKLYLGKDDSADMQAYINFYKCLKNVKGALTEQDQEDYDKLKELMEVNAKYKKTEAENFRIVMEYFSKKDFWK